MFVPDRRTDGHTYRQTESTTKNNRLLARRGDQQTRVIAIPPRGGNKVVRVQKMLLSCCSSVDTRVNKHNALTTGNRHKVVDKFAVGTKRRNSSGRPRRKLRRQLRHSGSPSQYCSHGGSPPFHLGGHAVSRKLQLYYQSVAYYEDATYAGALQSTPTQCRLHGESKKHAAKVLSLSSPIFGVQLRRIFGIFNNHVIANFPRSVPVKEPIFGEDTD